MRLCATSGGRVGCPCRAGVSGPMPRPCGPCRALPQQNHLGRWAYVARHISQRLGLFLLRHTLATHAPRARPNMRAVQELLGHAWVTTTQRYTHLEVEDLQEQVVEMPANHSYDIA